jgi:hypothetical protein
LVANQRTALLLVVAVALLTPAVLTVVWWSRLPDPVAVHWNGSGLSDNSGPRWLFAALPVGAAAVLMPIGYLARREAELTWLPSLLAAGVVLLGVMSVGGLVANVRAASWLDVRLNPGFIVAAFGLAVVTFVGLRCRR